MYLKTRRMRKITFLFSLVFMFFVYQSNAQIRLLKVDTGNGQITIKNFGGTTVDITGYRFCARFNYSGVTAGMVVSGDLNLSPDEEVIVSWNVILSSTATNSDLGLYLPTGGFNSAAAMLDFTQWGSAGNGRESVAVAKGIWTAGDFLSLATFTSPFVYFGDGAQNGLAFWSDVTLGVEDELFAKTTKIFPNPAVDHISIEGDRLNDGFVKIFNITGKLVKEVIDFRNINISELAAGLYFVEINSEGKKAIKKLVIR